MFATSKVKDLLGFQSPSEDDEYQDDEAFYEDEVEEETLAPARDLFNGQSLTPVVEEEPEIDLSRIVTVRPNSNFNQDAVEVGKPFREGVPVIMNLSKLNRSAAQRIVDFAYGMVYALNGHVEAVADNVFLLSPQNVRIDDQAGNSTPTGLIR